MRVFGQRLKRETSHAGWSALDTYTITQRTLWCFCRSFYGVFVEVHRVGGLLSCSRYVMTIIRHPIQYGVVHSTSSYAILYVVTNINHITHTQNENLPYAYIHMYAWFWTYVLCMYYVQLYVCTCVCVCVCVRVCACVCVQGANFGILNALSSLSLSIALSSLSLSLSAYRVDTLAYLTLSCSS